MAEIFKFPGKRPTRKAMTGDEFAARVENVSLSERLDLNARLRRMAEGISPPTYEDERPQLRKKRVRNEGTMHTFLFRSYDLIITSDEADLVRDVGLDLDKAQTKLRQIREQLQRDREHMVEREALLTACDTKLAAAIAAALPSGQR